jgi:ElaB/YqjD/DUF883 family membrane-anchored ribosome-binding protein
MNDQKLTKKVRQDAEKVKKEISTLVGDSASLLGRFGGNVSQATGKAKDDITAWVEDGVSQLGTGIDKATNGASNAAGKAAAAVKKDVGRGLRRYNQKAQELADRVPGGLGKKVASYPWVAISIAVALGFLLGGLLKPTRQPLG